MKIQDRVILLLIPVLLVSIAPMLIADYAQTSVRFTVATVTSFTVTLPGEGAVTSNATNNPSSPPTAGVNFSAATNTVNNIVPCVHNSASCQTNALGDAKGTPIFQYDNTGTTNITVTLIFNESLATGVSVRGNSSWDDTSVSNGTAYTGDTAVNATDLAVLGRSIDYNAVSILNVYLYANFSNVAAGTSQRLLNHTSTAG